VEHDGEFYRFEPVAFEPKPLQKPHPRIHVGGESDQALRRAAHLGDGWIGLYHTLDTVTAPLDRLRVLLQQNERKIEAFEITVMADVGSQDELAAWQRCGVTRLIVAPWKRSSEAVTELERLAGRVLT
jgi:alkanesulfonate monooxygenase SsuD/methylene tetrahydromethanopterin reductase-like flavin-dependent oxidoreductase (luciferase family)